jgi:phosphoribosylaminoimidazole-succinocarboxamide synthase
MKQALLATNCPKLDLAARGKVRDIYDLGDALLLVATDRISTFDVVFPNGVPDKGRVLTQISRFWFEKCADITPNHVISFDVADFPASAREYANQLQGRSLLCRKATPLTIECVVRGYLDGSAWAEYKETNAVRGHSLPTGLRQRSKLPCPIFTPSTKATSGHDMNITEDEAADIVGKQVFQAARDRSICLYTFAHDLLQPKGITLVDTKFEFGVMPDGSIILIDEALTPDSSRFMVSKSYTPDTTPMSFDKQFVRDWVVSTGWNKTPPAPVIPEDIINQTRERYLEAYRLITGKELEDR